jgi:hypothetical protein
LDLYILPLFSIVWQYERASERSVMLGGKEERREVGRSAAATSYEERIDI